MFVANHRDILLDAAVLQVLLFENGIDTSEITFGSNLMQGSLVVDIGKMNKMFRIMRGGTVKEFYKNSTEVSSYMRYAIMQKKQSVWIAQRNGRTKDGADKTDMAVLKMFALSSDKPFFENAGIVHLPLSGQQVLSSSGHDPGCAACHPVRPRPREGVPRQSRQVGDDGLLGGWPPRHDVGGVQQRQLP